MDGQENPFAQIYTSKLHEVQRYLSLTRHVYTPAYVAVGAPNWAKLPEDIRAILEETARETQGFVYETAARMDTEFLAALVASGLEVNEPDAERFFEASQAIYREFGSSVSGGRELVEAAMTLATQ